MVKARSNVADRAEGFRSDLRYLAEETLEIVRRKGLSLATAESCTAGKLALLLSEIPGAGKHVHGGFVTYTKANKTASLGVPARLLHHRGAVCCEVAVAMAKGALARTPADLAVAITGVAGPEPDEDGNPVGLVCIAVAAKGQKAISIEKQYGPRSRAEVQNWAMADALTMLMAEANSPTSSLA
jgi:nicotinamide-nucleotide amidase